VILITGGLGFLGSNLAEDLVRKEYNLVLVSRTDCKKQNIASFANKVKIEYGDVADLNWIQDIVLRYHPDIIFHLAAQLTGGEPFHRPFYDIDINCKSTLAILEAMRKLGKHCRFILGSTFWVVGKPDILPINEQTPCRPLNLYAANRLASEHYCRIYYLVYGLDTVVMRLSSIFGIKEQYDNPGKGAINYLLYKGYKGQPIPIYRRGEIFRDYIYVSDVVSAAETIMDEGKTGECYFVASGEKTWLHEIGRMIEELTPGKVTYVDAPDLYNQTDIGNIVIDSNKIRKLGWDWRVTVKDGLQKTLEYYRQIGL
jgi:UDP-glucose 4-epimerase